MCVTTPPTIGLTDGFSAGLSYALCPRAPVRSSMICSICFSISFPSEDRFWADFINKTTLLANAGSSLLSLWIKAAIISLSSWRSLICWSLSAIIRSNSCMFLSLTFSRYCLVNPCRHHINKPTTHNATAIITQPPLSADTPILINKKSNSKTPLIISPIALALLLFRNVTPFLNLLILNKHMTNTLCIMIAIIVAGTSLLSLGIRCTRDAVINVETSKAP
jgi:hypothetical protein